MNKLFRKFGRSKPFPRWFFIILSLAYIVGFVYFAKNVINFKIETAIRCIVLVLFLLYFYFFVFYSFVKLCKRKYLGIYLNGLLVILCIVLFSFGSSGLSWLFGFFNNLEDKDELIHTSYLITMKDTTFDEDCVLGMIEDKNNIEGYILAQEIYKDHKLKNKVKYYNTPEELLDALYKDELQAVFVSNNYVTNHSSEDRFANIASETYKLYEKSGSFENAEKKKASNKSLKEPVTMLIMGVDSEFNGLDANAAFNGDTLILATFNPDTLTVTLLSLPRDTYVPIACNRNIESKINSSAAFSTSCVIDTIQNLTKVDIDYYVKINFKGVVDLVDALGGIEVDVEEPYKQFNHGFDCKGMVCEQNSDRQWGDKTVYIGTGVQHLDGEQALAYARCRDLYLESDLARNRHQQDIILAIAKKASKLRSYDDFTSVFDSVSNNIATNMSTDKIMSGYDILKNMVSRIMSDEEFINIRKSYLETYNLNVYLPSSGMYTSALGYYEDSLNDIVKAMRINLGLEKATLTKTFNYSINETYEENIAGKNIRTNPKNSVIADLTGQNKAYAEKYCSDNNLSCSFKYIDSNSDYYDESIGVDLIAAQSPHAGSLDTGSKEMTIYIIGAD